ncbi:MAG: hypothetical protein LBQ01_03920 [Prevotellaceae bacterium]|jgi:hypothetical protein|nr:hypothetical protein [Prevotellaceae bacterium]
MKEYKYQYQEQTEFTQGDNEIFDKMFDNFENVSECVDEEDEDYDDDPSYNTLYGGHVDNETMIKMCGMVFAFIVGVPILIILILGLL